MQLFEFERLSSIDVQLSRLLIKYITLTLLEEGNSAYDSSDIDPTTNRQILEHATMKWVDSFLNRFNLVIRRQLGALSRLPSQTSLIERQVSYHLGCLQQRFEANLLDENMFDNMDETLYIQHK